ncbi:MAG TPA: GTP 3',8-cyclase MoaA [Cyclobacteriaceae bacterium]
MLYDNHNRLINYLRLAVTDRCNLRCFYCMPEEGINYVQKNQLLSFEEMYRIIYILGGLGISKLRITGGEPFVRRGIMDFLENVSKVDALKAIHITTNGSFTEDKVDQLQALGIKSVNLSLDSLDKDRFQQITRRDMFDQVMRTLDKLLASTMDVKINMVVMNGRNIEDIYSMIELTRDTKLSVRFIEEMPFNGTLGQGNLTCWPMKKIFEHISNEYAEIIKLPDPPNATSVNYQIPGYRGSFGIIAAYTRTFCGTCNRIRITPQGDLKTCLYDDGVLNLRDIIRSGASDVDVADSFKSVLQNRAKDGFEAEERRKSKKPVSESMATIGG